MTRVSEFAPAKVNLTLHVIGKRADGYHLLDSLVGFAAGIGDWVTVKTAPKTTLNVTGPFAADVPLGPENLVLKAAALMGAAVEITLEKNLPAASGIGGGSADAAATLRALSKLSGAPVPDVKDLLRLGADVPVCMQSGVLRMEGIGEVLTLAFGDLEWPMVLVNPRISVPTGQVFSGLEKVDNPPMPRELYDPAYFEFPEWLGRQRNDLQAAACSVAPDINTALDVILSETGCRIARMSGSGATCFGLFDTHEQARDAAGLIADRYPGWWVKATDP